jgi:sugar lactone lactonase YvrE
VRRLLTACAVTILSLSAFGLALKGHSVFAGARVEGESAASSGVPVADPKAAVPAKAIVVAQGVLARAIAHDDLTSLYLTTPTYPNRMFDLKNLSTNSEGAIASVNASANVVPFAGSGQTGSLGDAGTALLAQFDLKTDSIVMRSGVAVAPDGTVFIADTLNSTIRRISGLNSSEPGIVSAIAGRWASSESVTLVEPVGIALDRLGNLYIADHAAGAVYVLPSATSATPGALEILAHVVSPGSIAAAPDGSKVFVAAPDTGKVFAITTKTRAISTVSGFELIAAHASLSSSRVTGSYCGVTAETAPPDCPAGLAVDGAGNLFISDATFGQIIRVDARTGASKLAAGGLDAPGDLTFDVSGNLYLSEQGSDRILEFKGMGAPLSVLMITPPVPLPPPTAPAVCTALLLQPEAYSFCNEPTSGVTAAQTFTLTNNSSSAVNNVISSISPASTPSNFAIEGSTCTATLAAGSSCTINVVFSPQQSGEDDAALTVTDLAGDTASEEVGGTGTDYQLALANGQTMELSVEQGQSVTFLMVVTPDNIFSGNVTFVCPPLATSKVTSDGFVPPYTTCTITPASAVVSPGTPVPFSVTFKTTYNFTPPPVTDALPPTPIASGRRPGGTLPSLPARMLVFPALAIVTVLSIFLAALRRKTLRGGIWFGLRGALPALALFAVLLGVVFLGACHKKYTNPATETTPAGATLLTLTGTSQGASRGVTFTLDVVPFTPVLPGRVQSGGHGK